MNDSTVSALFDRGRNLRKRLTLLVGNTSDPEDPARRMGDAVTERNQFIGVQVKRAPTRRIDNCANQPVRLVKRVVGWTMFEPLGELLIGGTPSGNPARPCEIGDHAPFRIADPGIRPGDLEHRHEWEKYDGVRREPERSEILQHGGIVNACLLFECALGFRIAVGLPQFFDQLAVLLAEVFFLPRPNVIGNSVLVCHGMPPGHRS